MPQRIVCCLLMLLTSATIGVWAQEPNARADAMPWALREFFTVTTPGTKFVYAGDCAEWNLEIDGIGRVVPSALSRVTLADGAVLDPMVMGTGKARVNKHTSEYGKAAIYRVTMPPVRGLVLQHSVIVHDERPFYLIQVSVKNEGTEPVAIQSIEPAYFIVAGLDEGTIVGRRSLRARGPYLVPSDDPLAALVMLQDPLRDFSLAVGRLSMRNADTGIRVDKVAEGWRMNAISTFAPSLTLAPGQTLESDPIWLTFTLAHAAEVDQLFSWTHSVLPKPEFEGKLPDYWAAAAKGASAEEVYRLASMWADAGVEHMLAPASWETVPGSLTGARPQYPENMATLASRLRGLGMQPGLTLDPLSTEAGGPEFTATSADGRVWLNASVPTGYAHGVERLRRVAGWGFAFLAVEPSAIPDEALSTFGITRMQADALAFRMLSEAVPGVPVIPTAGRSVPATLDAWLGVSGTTSRLREYGVSPGPVAFDASSQRRLDPAMLTAMLFYGGGVEFRGECSSALREQLASVLPEQFLVARPMTIEDAPRLWLAGYQPRGASGLTEAVVQFPGAPSVPLAQLESAPPEVWHAESGDFLSRLPKPQRVAKPHGRRTRDVEVAEGEMPEQEAPPEAAPAPTPAPVPVEVASAPTAAPAEPVVEETTEQYAVKSGDTLSRIAADQKTTVADLRAWNGIKGDLITVGQVLVIRRKAESRAAPATSAAPAVAATAPAATSVTDASTYVVKAGDTVSGIAAKVKVAIADLRAWNNLTTDHLSVGQTLVIRREGEAAPDVSSPTPAAPAAAPSTEAASSAAPATAEASATTDAVEPESDQSVRDGDAAGEADEESGGDQKPRKWRDRIRGIFGGD